LVVVHLRFQFAREVAMNSSILVVIIVIAFTVGGTLTVMNKAL